jgi:hypothetical protein
MQYYTLELDAESQDLRMIIAPFDKYKYARLPMGLKCSPDIVQATMKNVFAGIKDADVYIDTKVHSHKHGNTTLYYALFYKDFVKMALPLTHSSVNGQSMKLIGLVTGLHLMV